MARAEALPPVRRSEIARKAALARWGARATHKGNFKEEFGIDVDCYVLDDPGKTAVISQRGMGRALGFDKGAKSRSRISGQQFLRSVKASNIAPYLGIELIEKLDSPIIFQGLGPGSNRAFHGYDVTFLIDICKAIVRAEADGKLLRNQEKMAKQAHVILGASAKAGIKGLVYALAGYSPTTEEVIAAFKLYVQEEARKYEPEFPNELYKEWHRLYKIPVPIRGKPWLFRSLTVWHVYHPLAASRGKIYELLKALKANTDDQRKKLFQFLNEIGARALRIHLGRVLEMAESSPDRFAYERKINERFGDQHELELVVPSPSSSSPPSS